MENSPRAPGASKEPTLARRLFIALVTPIALLMVMGLVLGAQVLRLVDAAWWVEHTDEVIGKLNSVERSIVDQEGSLRGYLLSDDRQVLALYEGAHPLQGIAQLRLMVADNPAQIARLEELAARYTAWFDESKRDLDKRDKSADALEARKLKMDEVRAALAETIDVERGLLAERAAASKTSYRTTAWLFVTLLLASGVALAVFSRRQLGAIAGTYGTALDAEREAREAIEKEAWIRAAQASVSDALRGELTAAEVGKNVLRELTRATGADVGAFYASGKDGWVRVASHALDKKVGSKHFDRGEGLVGQAALDGELVHLVDVPAEYLAIRSGTGARQPVSVVIAPAMIEGVAGAIVELGFLREPDPRDLELVRRVGENVASATRSAQYRTRLQELLEETQRQAEELQAQQEELRVSNEELEEQGQMLRKAQASLEEQQHELEQTNQNLEEQAELLSRQKAELVGAERALTAKATELERTNRYKSEFLANMSHELRTPLNSTLILAKLLADNKEGTLTKEQREFASTIYGAGNDLLTLINDILDLSKIEAGKIDINVGIVGLASLGGAVEKLFRAVADDKGVGFRIARGPDLPDAIETDGQRVEQILKNLLSNAFKFTEKGEVELRIDREGSWLKLAVSDTGIGVPREQQRAVFEAFHQADGTTARKYGGTGLGLSISRDLAALLGGELDLVSEPGRGSTFTLRLPVKYAGPTATATATAPQPAPIARAEVVDAPPSARRSPRHPELGPGAVEDDRHAVLGSGRVLLVIEDDVAFAKILRDLARELDFRCLVATTAEEGFELAKRFVPSAIVLDMELPDHPGLGVLDRLKHTSATRHIPVHVVSIEDYARTALAMGAVGYALKPARRDELIGVLRRLEQTFSRGVKRVLVVEDDDIQRQSSCALLSGEGVEVVGAATVAEALEKLSTMTFDCVVTDLTLPDGSGGTLLETMARDERYAFPPVIVYTGRSLTEEEEQHLGRLSNSIIVKGARSPERLLDEVTLFLHQVEARLPPERQRMLRAARDREAAFEGKRILVVEDDVRNVFALSSVLEPRGASVAIARNGREALDRLEKSPVDLVLMDVMMPEMDGLEATRRIRENPRWAKLPIIALTAKAMSDDRDKCLAAGANDYLAKPIDIEKLLSLVRVWIPK